MMITSHLRDFWLEKTDFEKGGVKLTKRDLSLAKMMLGISSAALVRYKGGMTGNTFLLIGTHFLETASTLKQAKEKIAKTQSINLIRGMRLGAWALGALTGQLSIETFGLYALLLPRALEDAKEINFKQESHSLIENESPLSNHAAPTESDKKKE